MQSSAGTGSPAAARARPIALVESGPGRGSRRRRPDRRAHRRAEPDLPRHRRHDRQVLAGRGRDACRPRPSTASSGAPTGPATRSWCPSSTSSRSAPAAARSRASTQAARSSSARRARAPIQGPPATGGAAPSRRSRTPSSSPGVLGARLLPRRAAGGAPGALARGPAAARRAARLRRRRARERHHPARGREHDQRTEARLGAARPRSARLRAARAAEAAAACTAAALGAELEVRKVIVPPLSGVFSAWGMCMTAPRADVVRTHILSAAEATDAAVSALFAELEEGAAATLERDGTGRAGEALCTRSVDARYRGQEHTVRVPVPDGPISVGGPRSGLPRAAPAQVHVRPGGGLGRRARHLPRLGARPRAARGGAPTGRRRSPARRRPRSTRASSTSTRRHARDRRLRAGRASDRLLGSWPARDRGADDDDARPPRAAARGRRLRQPRDLAALTPAVIRRRWAPAPPARADSGP